MNDHGGRVVAVTGAAQGIGFEIAVAYAGDGATVALLDCDEHQLAEASRQLPQHCHTRVCDVSKFTDVETTFAELQEQLGPVDTLVNNAGISPKHNGRKADFVDMAPAEWQRVVDVNLHGCFNTTRVLAPGMIERRFGRIVNMSSVAGKAYLDAVAAHYSTTKAALIGMTRHLAGELGPHNITVNALAPGRIETALMRMVPDAVNEAYRQVTPMRRFGAPAEVASACLFLTSPKADFITGQVVDVAGGWLMT